MEDDCEPELRLSLGRSGDTESQSTTTEVEVSSGWVEGISRCDPQRRRQQQQQITIFYNGRICVCNVTEIKARAIIAMAKREMDNTAPKNNQQQQHMATSSLSPSTASSQAPSSPPQALQQLLNPAAGLSMKKSLQRFLQKRKTRLNAASPYGQSHTFLPPIMSKQQPFSLPNFHA